MRFGVLGPVTAFGAGGAIALPGHRHRAVLARLLVAHGRVVPVDTLIDDLRISRGALQTFVGALRRVLEPDRPPRSRSTLLATEGDGYALRAVTDAQRFEELLRSSPSLADLEQALGEWRGPAYADVPDPWVLGERARLGELRLVALESKARAEFDLGRAGTVVADLDAHVAEHPWREEGWRLLALALYRSARQKEALDVIRTARRRLVDELGLEPGPALQRLEHDILNHVGVWADAATAYSRVAPGERAGLRTAVDLLRSLAITGGGGLVAAREQRVAAIRAAEEHGDVGLTARVIGAFDVPAVWSRVDDEEQARAVVAAAERTLAALPAKAPAGQRVRLLATIAIESRGQAGPRGPEAARTALEAARATGDPALVVFALNGLFLQSFSPAGRCRDRDVIGTELIELAAEHDLEAYEILGRLVRVQALSGLGDFAAADREALAVDRLAEDFGSPMVSVFTSGYRALGGRVELPAGVGMPGLTTGLTALSVLSVALRDHDPAPPGDYGPYEPWTRPLTLIAEGRPGAAEALRAVPDPPPGHFLEALWCLVARAAVTLGDAGTARRARAALEPAAHELAGAGSGLITFGPVQGYLDELG